MELLKVIRVIISGKFYLCGNRYEAIYFMMRQKLLIGLKDVCRATSHKMDEFIVVKHQVDGTQYLYTYTYLFYTSYSYNSISRYAYRGISAHIPRRDLVIFCVLRSH